MERHCANFFTPTQTIGGRQLSTQEVTWNEWLQLVRSRVEHLNTVVKNHRMFKGEPYRDWVQGVLEDFYARRRRAAAGKCSYPPCSLRWLWPLGALPLKPPLAACSPPPDSVGPRWASFACVACLLL